MSFKSSNKNPSARLSRAGTVPIPLTAAPACTAIAVYIVYGLIMILQASFVLSSILLTSCVIGFVKYQ